MAHKFDVSHKNKLDNEERRRLLAPFETLERLGFQKGGRLADVGCGTGLFTIPAAQIGGQDSKIYAIDVSEEMLGEVERRAIAAGCHSIQTVRSDEYDFRLNAGAVDFVLICAVLHEIGDKGRFLREAARICRAGGNIAIIEFNETNTDFGPPLSERLSREQVRELMADSGFINEAQTGISGAFYAVTAEKPLENKF